MHPGSWGSATMLSKHFNRSTDIFRNALGHRPITRFFATRSSFLCKVCQLRVVHLKSSLHGPGRIKGMGTLSEGFGRFVVAPLLPKRRQRAWYARLIVFCFSSFRQSFQPLSVRTWLSLPRSPNTISDHLFLSINWFLSITIFWHKPVSMASSTARFTPSLSQRFGSRP